MYIDVLEVLESNRNEKFEVAKELIFADVIFISEG